MERVGIYQLRDGTSRTFDIASQPRARSPKSRVHRVVELGTYALVSLAVLGYVAHKGCVASRDYRPSSQLDSLIEP